jgi:hypothetical protein
MTTTKKGTAGATNTDGPDTKTDCASPPAVHDSPPAGVPRIILPGAPDGDLGVDLDYGTTTTSTGPSTAVLEPDAEARATARKVEALHRLGTDLRNAQGVLPADDAGVLARALRDVNRARVERGDPALTADLLDLLGWALDHEPDRGRLVPGGTFALDQPTTVPSLWGQGDEVLWSQGEPLFVVGPIGIGKSTVALRLVLARVGVGPTNLLGFPVVRDPRPTLYVAADRPRQVARNLHRMVHDSDRPDLDARVLVWPGPLGYDLAAQPTRLAEQCRDLGVGCVVLDSLKDVALNLADGDAGGRVNLALQSVIAEGVDVVVQHHVTKHGPDGRPPKELADVYGSTFITAGAGSVVLLWGRPGDPVFKLLHLKAPMAPVGPMDVELTLDGQVVVHEGRDLLGLLEQSPKGMTVTDVARLLYEVQDPDRPTVEKARRSLERLVARGVVHKTPGRRGGANPTPDVYHRGTNLLPPEGE